ncbi:hypothetical protein D082_17880 [Synechocystis sp. PCC 6714]|nr:hypothetical protein D082_17880 [Synechocystis sp. PCC 6714]
MAEKVTRIISFYSKGEVWGNWESLKIVTFLKNTARDYTVFGVLIYAKDKRM